MTETPETAPAAVPDPDELTDAARDGKRDPHELADDPLDGRPDLPHPGHVDEQDVDEPPPPVPGR